MKVEVNDERCEQIARTLAARGLPKPEEPWSVRSDQVSFDLATLNFVTTAICHQTQVLEGVIDGKSLRGWDYLQGRFQCWAKEDRDRLTPDKLGAFCDDELIKVLDCRNQWSVDDISRRASFVRDCGAGLRRAKFSSITDLYERSGRRIATGVDNLLGALCEFQAFDDPLKKKAMFLLGLNSVTCGWTYDDSEFLDPPVDYHEVRGHLRLGTVRVLDDNLRQLIKRGDVVAEEHDIAIRAAVLKAIRRVSALCGLAPMQLHYAFWNLFRTVCVRGRPLCFDPPCHTLPSAYLHLIANGSCCFVCECDSVGLAEASDEHQFKTHWY